MEESRAKGLQTYTEQQAAKQAKSTVQNCGTSQDREGVSQSLHNTEAMSVSPPEESDDDDPDDYGGLTPEEEEEAVPLEPAAYFEDGDEEEELELCLSLSSSDEG